MYQVRFIDRNKLRCI